MTTPTSIEERMARLEGSYEQIDRRLATLEQDQRAGFDRLGGRIDRVEERIESVRSELGERIESTRGELGERIERVRGELTARMDRQTYWLMGLLGAMAVSIIVSIVTRIV